MIRENTKMVAAFVVPVLIIAGVVGYQLYREDEIPIEVKEGFAEVTVEYQPPMSPSWGYMLSPTATTYINDNSSLELNVTVASVIATSRSQEIKIGLDVEGDFEEDLLPKTLEFRVRGYEGINVSANVYEYKLIYGEVTGCSIQGRFRGYGWGTDTAKVGFDIDSPRFEIEWAEMRWIIPTSNFGNPYTLEIQAVVGGLSEEVIATVHVHIDLFSKIESLEASIDKEHYLTSDYPSEESRHGVYPEITYKFENLPGGEDVLYDVEIYAHSPDFWGGSGEPVRRILFTNKTAGTLYDATINILLFGSYAELDYMEFELRFVITSQEGNWVYDSMEDDNFHLTFTVTHDGGGDK